MRPWLGPMLLALMVVAPLASAGPPAGLPAVTSWTSDTTLGTPVTLVAGDLLDPIMVSDGAGGFIALWLDLRKPGFDPDLYCQRVSASGESLWAAGGQVVCNVAGVQNRPTMIADGQGGVFIAWGDLRTVAGGPGYYLQRLAPNGVPRWAANGIRPVSGFDSQAGPRICLDDIGGIFFAFGSANGTQLQRLDSLGIKRLGGNPEGTLLRANPSSAAAIVADGLGGAIVALSYGSASNLDLSALRVAASGTVVWDPGGNPVCLANGVQGPVDIVSDGANGAILAWDDARDGEADIYAQRMSAEGDAIWAVDGIPLCADDSVQTGVRLRAQADGSAVAVWRDYRFLPATSLYAQRVAGDGSVAWALDGVPVCSGAPVIERYSVTPGLGEDTFVAWNTLAPPFGGDVFAQRIDGGGHRLWGEYGATVCRGPNDQTLSAAVGDGRGGLYVGYRDRRDLGEPNLYAHHLGAGGVPGPVVGVEPTPGVRALREWLRGVPNPARGVQSLAFARPVAAGARVEVLDLSGRRRVVRELAGGTPSWIWDGHDDQGAAVEPGLYFVRVIDGARTAVGRVVRLD